MLIPIDKILPNPEQPRRELNRAELEGLAASIRQDGVIQPITVEQAGDRFILQDGERRLRAARIAGLNEVPAHVVPPLNGNGGQERLARALVANIQRSDLNPIEEAHAYYRLKHEYGYSDSQIAIRLGVSLPRVSQRLILLKLDPEIQELMAKDELWVSYHVARAILSISQKEARIGLARKAAQGRYSVKEIVRAAEKIKSSLEKMNTRSNRSKTLGLEMGLSHARQPLDLPKWNALSQIGRVPLWDVVEKSATHTCDRCSLRSLASENTCQECPLPVVLKNMIDAAMSIDLGIPLRKKVG